MDIKRFSIGRVNFDRIIKSGSYYVDKTAYLKELFMGSTDAKANIFIRPRRFGKTLNMQMVKSFCELNYQNPGDKSHQEEIFLDNGRNFAVSSNSYKDLRDNFMGEFPVISFSFKEIQGHSYITAINHFLETITDIYDKFSFIVNSTKIPNIHIKRFISDYEFCTDTSIDLNLNNNLSRAERIITSFLPRLAKILYHEYNRGVIILIDEYDVPLQKSVMAKEPYYDEMLAIIRDISSQTFKPDRDDWLYTGIVTGCLKIAHQSIFRGANNFKLNGLDDEKYAEFFGFTRSETEKLLNDCGLSTQTDAVTDWYDGYRIGNEHIFCPWSVLSFCDKALGSQYSITPEPFWVNTSGNDTINLYLKNLVNENFTQDIQRMEELLNNVPQEITLQEFETYPNIKEIGVDFDTCMTLLLQTGYLTFTEDSSLHKNVFLKIPNREIRECFELKLKNIYGRLNPVWFNLGEKLFLHLLANEADDAEKVLNLLLGKFISIRNSGNELFYHGFMLGLLLMVATSDKIKLESDQETGDGYSDIIISHAQLKTIVIIELKKTENNDKKRLAAAKDATKQIIRKKYADGFDKTKYPKIYGFGIAFGGKSCAIKSLGNLLEMS